MRFTILFYLLFFATILTGQTNIAVRPDVKWTITNKKVTNEYLEFSMQAKIPDGYMILTEADTSSFNLPLCIVLRKSDSLLMKHIDIRQLKGEREDNTGLKEIFNKKVETTKGDVAFRVRIYLKKRITKIQLTGEIAFWILTEDLAYPPIFQAFIINFSR